LERGAEVNAKTNQGWTPLHYTACYQSMPDVAKVLLERGAHVNAKTNQGWTPLMEACWKGNVRIGQLLLENGADTVMQNNAGQTTMQIALQANRPDVLKLLKKPHTHETK